MIEFHLRNGKTDRTPCYAKLNLLGHCQLNEIGTGSQCGGHGICGKDRVLILSASEAEALSPPSAEELKHLRTEELAQGIRLACQCYPQKDDLDLEIRVL